MIKVLNFSALAVKEQLCLLMESEVLLKGLESDCLTISGSIFEVKI